MERSSPASPGNLSTLILVHFHFHFSSLFSCGFISASVLSIPASRTGSGSWVGKLLNQKGSPIYGVILGFINSFYDIGGRGLFPKSSFVVWVFCLVLSCFVLFLTRMHGCSWLSALCLLPDGNTAVRWICPESAQRRLSTFPPPAFRR